MGWLPWSSSSSPSPTSTTPSASAPPQSADGYTPPLRHERDVCWAARDAFFACLDQHSIIDSVRNDAEARQKCGAVLERFERDCAASWVTYFKKRRVMEAQREATIRRLEREGADVKGAPSGGR
ncbi:hypothetical protein ANO11243_002340 [Dothideomycetidae sp. 11243]|nr:hypothetical protein ANO11243_002340 [fungal sp. No.11243]